MTYRKTGKFFGFVFAFLYTPYRNAVLAEVQQERSPVEEHPLPPRHGAVVAGVLQPIEAVEEEDVGVGGGQLADLEAAHRLCGVGADANDGHCC